MSLSLLLITPFEHGLNRIDTVAGRRRAGKRAILNRKHLK
jgi:hypothetical protein